MRKYTKSKLVYGFGVNDADYQISHYDSNGRQEHVCQFYAIWKSMIFRCYHKKGAYYGKVSVCDEWLTFSNFKKWMEKQDWCGKEIDKDLLGDGKHYSEKSCVFLPKRVNVFISKVNKENPEECGFFYVERRTKDKYMATIADLSRKCRRRTIGYFPTAADANAAFWREKEIQAMEIFLTYGHPCSLVVNVVMSASKKAKSFYDNQEQLAERLLSFE